MASPGPAGSRQPLSIWPSWGGSVHRYTSSLTPALATPKVNDELLGRLGPSSPPSSTPSTTATTSKTGPTRIRGRQKKFGAWLVFLTWTSFALLAAVIGFLSWIWFGNRDEERWKRLIMSPYNSRSVTVSGVFIRYALSTIGWITAAMMASIIVESHGVPRERIAEASLARYTGSLMQMGFRPYALTSWFRLLIPVQLLCGIATQFTSSFLFSDISAGVVPGFTRPQRVLFDFQPSLVKAKVAAADEDEGVGDDEGQQVPEVDTDALPLANLGWDRAPQTAEVFAEYAEPEGKSTDPRIDDTGPVWRALLPVPDAAQRTSLKRYSGVAKMFDARVVCVNPNITELSLLRTTPDTGFDSAWATSYEGVATLDTRLVSGMFPVFDQDPLVRYVFTCPVFHRRCDSLSSSDEPTEGNCTDPVWARCEIKLDDNRFVFSKVHSRLSSLNPLLYHFDDIEALHEKFVEEEKNKEDEVLSGSKFKPRQLSLDNGDDDEEDDDVFPGKEDAVGDNLGDGGVANDDDSEFDLVLSNPSPKLIPVSPAEQLRIQYAGEGFLLINLAEPEESHEIFKVRPPGIVQFLPFTDTPIPITLKPGREKSHWQTLRSRMPFPTDLIADADLTSRLEELELYSRELVVDTKASLCFDVTMYPGEPTKYYNINATHSGPESLSEPRQNWIQERAQYNLTGVLQQLGATSDKLSAPQRNILSMSRESVYDVIEKMAEPYNITELVPLSDKDGNSTLPYNTGMADFAAQALGAIGDYPGLSRCIVMCPRECVNTPTDVEEYAYLVDADPYWAAMFAGVLDETDSPALALQAIGTAKARMDYMGWISAYTLAEEADVTVLEPAQLPVRVGGFVTVVALVVAQTMLFLVASFQFRNCRNMLLNNAWVVVSQIACSNDAGDILARAKAMTDAQVAEYVKGEKEKDRNGIGGYSSVAWKNSDSVKFAAIDGEFRKIQESGLERRKRWFQSMG